MWQLIACRAVMGVGAAFIMPSTLSILVNVFPPDERTKAIAIWASVTGAAGAIGPVASGWLLGHFWYGSVFLVNVPILADRPGGRAGSWCPSRKDPEQGQLDPVGAVLSIIGIVALVYGLIEAPPGRLGQRRRRSAAFAVGRRRAHPVRVVGAAGRRADARHALLQEPGVQHRHRRA